MEEIRISTPIVWKEEEAEMVLIDKILSNKSYTRATLLSILRKAWNLQTGLDIIEITGKAFMFKFEDEEEYNRILRGRPWSINGSLLNLMERPKYKASEEFVFSHSPFWIQIHNVPLKACLENAISIGETSVRKALVPGFWLPKPDGTNVWISVRYEKLQNFCYNCGKIGHDRRDCIVERSMEDSNTVEKRYGAWLTTPVSRSWEETMVVVRCNGAEGEYIKKKKMEGSRSPFSNSRQEKDKTTDVDAEDLFSIKSPVYVPVARENGPVYAREFNDHDCPTSLKPDANSQPEDGYSISAMLKANTSLTEGPKRAEVLYDKIKLGTTKEMEPVITLCSVVNSHGVEYGNIPGPQLDNQLAIIPYCGKEINAVINSLSCLGLKRSAADAGECADPKRRRMIKVSSGPGAGISSYANNLRKTKAKIKRSVKKRTRGEKENFPVEEVLFEEEMEISDSNTPMSSNFIFKASSGRKKKFTADGSDHHALLVDSCYQEEKSPRSFKFEAIWAQHEEFQQIVGEAWQQGALNNANRIPDVVNRLTVCQKKLTVWSRIVFPNFRKSIEILRQKLNQCMLTYPTPHVLSAIEDLTSQIEDAWAKEESYWWQRSRISWLNCGDKNTKFFHTSVIQRRQRNKILRLKNDSGVWLEDKEEINKAFSTFYQQLFNSVGPRSLDQALSYVKRVISDAENESLMRSFRPELD
ncbi:hypothetical protein K1719_046244 [Acacia pycnantha]|nr:hypothetical protein K1719_046244 [Acacia pycnantha]